MASINLLPWREELREERKAQFQKALLASVIYAAIILYIVMFYFDKLIEEQSGRNSFLKNEIVQLDIINNEISDIDNQRQKLLARMQVIQSLQKSRPKVVRVFDSFARMVPEDMNMSKVTRSGDLIIFDGVAQSNARISSFMHQIDKNEEYGESRLKVIERTKDDDKDVKRFTIEVNESQLGQEDQE